jgi:hypothetical protein
MELGRSNIARTSLYSILGGAMTLNFEHMVRRRTPQISNIAINSLNSISDMPCIFEFKEVNIEFSKFIAVFDI